MNLLQNTLFLGLFMVNMIELSSCQSSNPPMDISGKWIATKIEGKHKFSDGNTSIAATMPNDGDYIQFTKNELKKDIENGVFNTVQYGMPESGTYELNQKTRELIITYTSFEPHFMFFRTVKQADGTTLILTADDAVIKKGVKENHLMENSPVKIIGGDFYEEYVKSKE